MRYLAEAVWYPTTLLPGQGLEWEAIDEYSAKAILTDGHTTVSLLFTFNKQGAVETVYSDSRGRSVDGKIIPTPWRGRFFNYAERRGMQIPLNGEVAWVIDESEKTYWRGKINQINYEFAKN